MRLAGDAVLIAAPKVAASVGLISPLIPMLQYERGAQSQDTASGDGHLTAWGRFEPVKSMRRRGQRKVVSQSAREPCLLKFGPSVAFPRRAAPRRHR